jgi:hypothetical protein
MHALSLKETEKAQDAPVALLSTKANLSTPTFQ